MTHTHNQDELDRYLLGRMTPGEEAGFTERLESDERLREEVGLLRRILRVISIRASRFECMRRWDRRSRDYAPCANVVSVVADRLWPQWIMVAASVIIFIAVGMAELYGDKAPAPTASINRHDVQPVSATARRGASMEVAGIERQLRDLRKAASYTLSDINTAMTDDNQDLELRHEEAEYLSLLSEYDRYELTWLRIQTLIAAGRIAEAKVELEKYAAEEGYNQHEALSLLKQFE